MAGGLGGRMKLNSLMCARSLTLSTSNCNDQVAKRARVMVKLLNKGKKKMRFGIPIKADSPFGGPVGNTRRATVISNLFMENITDVMSTEECGLQLRGYGIEITCVKVAVDCKIANVYWTMPSSNFDQVNTVSKLLKACAGEIRSEMIRHHVLGIVPHINFVQDKIAKNAAEVERLLSIADYGPDYIPVSSGKALISDTVADLKASVKEQSDKAPRNSHGTGLSSSDDFKQQYENSDDILNFPPMKMNVFGLDYTSIMNQVIRKMKNPDKLEHNKDSDVSECIKDNLQSLPDVDFDTTAENHSIALENFLKNRNKIVQKKHKKALETMLVENDRNSEDNQELLENSKLYLEDDDYYDESDIDGNRHYIPEDSELDNK